jgi:hypothetical protein
MLLVSCRNEIDTNYESIDKEMHQNTLCSNNKKTQNAQVLSVDSLIILVNGQKYKALDLPEKLIQQSSIGVITQKLVNKRIIKKVYFDSINNHSFIGFW